MALDMLVAGGTGALGTAVVAELLSCGYAVTATWVVEGERERAEAEHGARDGFSLCEADLFDPEAAARAVAGVESLAAVVNLVGGFASGARVHEMQLSDLDRMLRLNLVPGFNLARAAMPVLAERGGGAYVGVSARAALRPFAGASAYVTAKAAVLAFVKALDADYGSDGVRANAVLPSVIDTPANRKAMPDADFSKWVSPAEIARVVRFLVSDDSAPVSGTGVPVYGRA